ncbi:MAG: ABC transporter permease [Calditrichaeota bacterium]|nr:MAG: ABC transporter permease [Calditrichota bacterium]
MRVFSELPLLFRDLWSQKLRTILTLFGVTWGTASIILLLAFGTGVDRQNMKNMKGIGEGVVIVWGGKTSKPYKGFNRGRNISLKEEDVELLRREIPQIQLISPEYSTWRAQVRGPKNVDNTNITGVIPEYGDIRNVFAAAGGRFINDLDLRWSRRVAFLGNDLRDFLFGKNQDAIGQTVYIDRTPFTVIGVLKKKRQNSSYNTRDQNRVFIPATTFRTMFGHRYISNLVYKVVSPAYSKSVERRMYEILGKKYTFDPTDKDALYVWDTTKYQKIFQNFFLGFKIFLGIIGSFTLAVGGIGVANIMYVVVRERTPEIGIKRSVGAKRRHILFQFLFEAFLLVGIGAMIGFLIAIGLVQALQMIPESMADVVGRPAISAGVALACILLLGLVGILAGYFPARRAAMIDPVLAIRGT